MPLQPPSPAATKFIGNIANSSHYGFWLGYSHTGNVIRARMVTRANFIPPYAPDNPDEFVWQHAKTNGVSKKPLKPNESLKERVKADLAGIKANPKRVRSFFNAPSVAYATD